MPFAMRFIQRSVFNVKGVGDNADIIRSIQQHAEVTLS